MFLLNNILVFLHIIGAAIIIGLWIAHFRTPKVLPGQFHASLLMLITGLLLVGIAEVTGSPNHIKIAVKILIALGISIAAFIGQRKYKAGEPNFNRLSACSGPVLPSLMLPLPPIWH